MLLGAFVLYEVSLDASKRDARYEERVPFLVY